MECEDVIIHYERADETGWRFRPEFKTKDLPIRVLRDTLRDILEVVEEECEELVNLERWKHWALERRN